MGVERKSYEYSAVDQDLTDKLRNEQFEEENSKQSVAPLGYRHLQVFIFFLLAFIAFGFRITLSVGIVAMTDPTASINPDIPTYPEWKDKNVILSAFFWGYVIPQVFAGWAAGKFGAKWFLIITTIIQSLLCILMPFTAAQVGSKGIMISRALQGFCQGFIYPSLTYLLSQWVPSEERSLLGTIVFAAGPAGTVVAMSITGIISASWYGWPMVFYLYGAIGILWCLVMLMFGYNSPADHPKIGKTEKSYIESSLGHQKEKKKHSTPWKNILTSAPVWALFAAQTGSNYSAWTLLTQIPSYMNYVMKFNIKDNSLLSSLPFLSLWILSFVFGYVSDVLINGGIFRRSTGRKVFNSVGLLVPAIFLILLGFTRPDQRIQAVMFLILAVASAASSFSGFGVNHMDLSPNHSGTIMGFCNGFSQITGVIAPLVVQVIVTNETDPLQWRQVFFIAAAINCIAASIFAIFGSGDVQHWNEEKEEEALE